MANGPNLNLVGLREPDIYGQQSLESYIADLDRVFSAVELVYFQSNVEGEIVNMIQKFGFDSKCIGIVLNAGGYAHTSISIADAVKAVPLQTVNVHISNVYNREKERHTDLIAAYAIGSIIGCGLFGYRLAIELLLENQRTNPY